MKAADARANLSLPAERSTPVLQGKALLRRPAASDGSHARHNLFQLAEDFLKQQKAIRKMVFIAD